MKKLDCPKIIDGLPYKSTHQLTINFDAQANKLRKRGKENKSKVKREYYNDGSLRLEKIFTSNKKDYLQKTYKYSSNKSFKPNLEYYSFYKRNGNGGVEKIFNPKDSTLKEIIEYKIISEKKKKVSSTDYYKNGNVFCKAYYSLNPTNLDKRFSRPDSLYSYYKSGQLKRKEYFNPKLKSTGMCFDLSGKKIKFTPMETPALFPGGEDAMLNFLGNNISYPRETSENGITGIVYATFIVYPSGKLGELHIEREIDKATSAEVLKVIRLMPKWIPAQVDGKKVRSYFTLPIQFTEPE